MCPKVVIFFQTTAYMIKTSTDLIPGILNFRSWKLIPLRAYHLLCVFDTGGCHRIAVTESQTQNNPLNLVPSCINQCSTLHTNAWVCIACQTVPHMLKRSIKFSWWQINYLKKTKKTSRTCKRSIKFSWQISYFKRTTNEKKKKNERRSKNY